MTAFTAAAARKTVRTTHTDAAKLSGVKNAAGDVVAYTFATADGQFGFLTAAGVLGRLGWDRRDAAARALDAAAGFAPLDVKLPACDGSVELLAILSTNPYRDLAETLPACDDDCHGVAFRSDYKGTCDVQASLFRCYSDGNNAADYTARAERHQRNGKTFWAGNLRKSVAADRAQMERVVAIWAQRSTCERVPVTPFGE